jgi:type IV pilus assembly protein PilM
MPSRDSIKKLLTSDVSSLKKARNASKPLKLELNSIPKNTRNVVSIDIGSEKIKFVVGRFSKGRVIIEKAFMVDTPEGTIGDGTILNSINLARTIEGALSIEQIKVKDANCTTNSTAVINREIVIPPAAEDEMDTLVKYEIQQYLPINMDDYVIQYNVLEEVNNDNLLTYRVLVITYPNKMAKQYYELISNCKLRPNVLDVTYNSIKKLAGSMQSINDREYNLGDTTVFIDMGAANLNVNIYNGNKMDFTRIIKSGGSIIDREISKAFSISLEEAEKRKIEQCNFGYDEINSIIRTVVDDWVEELNRIIQFYKNKKVGNKLDKLYIYGGCSNLKGISEYLSSKLGLKVEMVEALGNVELYKTAAFSDLNCYLNAIGAIIRL